MVLFDNIQVGQVVEVLRTCGGVNLAKVRFKGSMNGRKGDWVGLEMASKVGNSNGLVSGRRYFFVEDGYGLFTTADKIRFISITRNSFDNYQAILNKTNNDDLSMKKYEDCKNLKFDKKMVLSKAFIEKSYSFDKLLVPDDEYYRYPLRHLISKNKDKPKVEVKAKSTKSKCYHIPSDGISYYLHHKDFITPATITNYFIPKNKLRTVMKSDVDKIHLPKTHNHFEMRDFLHNEWWNDVSL